MTFFIDFAPFVQKVKITKLNFTKALVRSDKLVACARGQCFQDLALSLVLKTF